MWEISINQEPLNEGEYHFFLTTNEEYDVQLTFNNQLALTIM